MRICPCRFALLVLLASTSASTSRAATTGFSGGGQVMLNEQPSLPINYVVRVHGLIDDLGEVGMFAGTFAPRDWQLAEGQLLSISQHPDLFDKLGTAFGGDGTSSFALPDLRGRTPIGVGQGPGLPNYFLGLRVGGVETASAALPPHNHGINSTYTTATVGQFTHSNMQPSLALTPIIATTGVYPSRSIIAGDWQPEKSPAGEDLPNFGFGDEPLLGEMTWIAHDQIPNGWLKADGRLLDIVDHEALFSLLGTAFGGDGETNFALPDLRGRTAVGTGSGAGLTPRRSGEQFGADVELLTEAHVPPHVHSLSGGGVTESTGGGAMQSNLQPSLGITHLVALQGVYPTQSIVANANEPQPAGLGSGTSPFIGSISMFAGDFAPRDFARADGQLLNISLYQALFSLVGTIYGGDGEATFQLPDLRGRLSLQAGSGAGLPFRGLGQKFGAENSAVALGQLAAHAHNFTPLAGDWDLDGDVDAFNFLQWQRGESPDPRSVADLLAWESSYGATSSAIDSAHRVPEPHTLALVALTGCLQLINRIFWDIRRRPA